MSPNRTTRSTRSNSSGVSTRSKNRASRNSRPFISPSHRAAVEKSQKPKRKRKRSAKAKHNEGSSTGLKNPNKSSQVAAHSSDTDANDDGEDTSPPGDVSAPFGDVRKRRKKQASSSLPKVARNHRTGPDDINEFHDTVNDEQESFLDASHLDKDADIASSVTGSTAFESESVRSSEVSSEVCDDDNYNDIDKISDTSESSEQFEKEVEKEIIAEGEDGIDWDDNATYEFDHSWDASQYSAGLGIDSLHPFLDVSVFSLENPVVENNTEMNPTEKALLEAFPGGIEVDHDWSSSSSRSDASKSSSSGPTDSRSSSRRSSEDRGATQTPRRITEVDLDDPTDDEALPVPPTVNSPAVTLAQRPSRKRKGARKLQRNSAPPQRDTRHLFVMRKIRVSPHKAVAYSTTTVSGKFVHFTPPRVRTLKWVDMKSSQHSSRAHSPAEIDYRAALARGNTGNGTFITDVIHGRLFQQFHCSPLTSRMGRDTFSEFATLFPHSPFLTHRKGFLEHIDDMMLDEDAHAEAMNLIDFEGGERTLSEEAERSKSQTPTTPKSPVSNHSFESFHGNSPASEPPTSFAETLNHSQSRPSPKKRMMSSRTNDDDDDNKDMPSKRAKLY